MRINSIQPSQMRISQTKSTLKTNNPKENPIQPAENPQFKGKGNGALFGLGGGLVTGLATVGGAAIAGIFTLPVLVGGAVIIAAGAAGAKIGDKIEDKIEELKNK